MNNNNNDSLCSTSILNKLCDLETNYWNYEDKESKKIDHGKRKNNQKNTNFFKNETKNIDDVKIVKKRKISDGDDTHFIETSKKKLSLHPKKFLPKKIKKKINCVTINVDESQDDLFDELSTGDDIQPSTNNSNLIQIQSDQLLSDYSSEDKQDLQFWGLPEHVIKAYNKVGIVKIFPWQVECLSISGILEGGNLVYSAPTSAGKTLVSEFLLMKRVIETEKKALLILPFVSIAREKTYHLQSLLKASGIRVAGFMGSHCPPGGFQNTDVAVCTIEKANNLINRLIKEDKLDQLSIVVVDELHMVGDPHRGYLLELMLTKLRYISAQKNLSDHVQIVGMSATLPNLGVLASWLNAKLYSTDYRPIPLVEMVKIGNTIYDKDFNKLRDLEFKFEIKNDAEGLVNLCLETILAGFSVLVFCPTKAWCEKIALSIAANFFEIGKDGSCYPSEVINKLRKRLNGEVLVKVIELLSKTSAGLDAVLGKSLGFGAAFHHAGLTIEERDILEGSFRSGDLPVLVATSTLSSGVNLPARRVIIRSPNNGPHILNTLSYKQMVGRAGRTGKDTMGESILMCKTSERYKAETLLQCDLPAITSCLKRQSSISSSLKRALLEIIVSGAAETVEDVEKYYACSLLATTAASDVAPVTDGSPGLSAASQNDAIQTCIEYLIDKEFIRRVTNENISTLKATQLGNAILASGLSPDEGFNVFSELHKARGNFVLENELHVVYQVTPIYVSDSWPNLDWLAYLDMWEKLSPDMRRVGSLVGVRDSFLVRAMKGTINSKIASLRKELAIHQRFYAAMALHDLVHEVPLKRVIMKYGATKGLLQALQQSAATFAGMVAIFCRKLGWYNLELLIDQYKDRLQFGVERDLCDLVRITLLNGPRARTLFSAGIETVADLAHAEVNTIENALLTSQPFETAKLKKCSVDVICGPDGKPIEISDAANMMVIEARQIIEKEIGLSGIQWSQNVSHRRSITTLIKTDEETNTDCRGMKRSCDIGEIPIKNLKQNAMEPVLNNVPVNISILEKNEDHSFNKNKSHICQNSTAMKTNDDILPNNENYPNKINKILLLGHAKKKSKVKNGMEFEENKAIDASLMVLDSALTKKRMGNEPNKNVNMENEPNLCNLPTEQSSSFKLYSKDYCSLAENMSHASNLTRDRSSSQSQDLFDADGSTESNPEKNDAYAIFSEELDFEFNLTDSDSSNMDELKLSNSQESLNNYDCEVNIMTESGMMSLTRDNIEEYLEAFDSLTAPRTVPKSIDSTARQDEALSSLGFSSTNKSPKMESPCVNEITSSFFNDVSSLLLTPHTEAVLDGKEFISNKKSINIERKISPKCVKNDKQQNVDLSLIKQKSMKNLTTNEICSRGKKGVTLVATSKKSNKELCKSNGVVCVTSETELFQEFIDEWKKKKDFSCIFVTQKISCKSVNGGIGYRICSRSSRSKRVLSQTPTSGVLIDKSGDLLIGLAIYWGDEKRVYYISLRTNAVEDPELSSPTVSEELSIDNRVSAIREVLCKGDERVMFTWDAKSTIKMSIQSGFGIIRGNVYEPRIASWMLDPTAKPKNLKQMATEERCLYYGNLVSKDDGAKATDKNNTRAVARECVLVYHTNKALLAKLDRARLLSAYKIMEIPNLKILAYMELTGMGFSNSVCEEQKNLILEKIVTLEDDAVRLVGRRFSFSSPKDVSTIIYKELSLRHPSTSMHSIGKKSRAFDGPTNKEALEVLKDQHKLPGIILEWRRLNSALTKTIQPLQRVRKHCGVLAMDRIHSISDFHTATGRITLHEPSLQMVPRDFELCIPASKAHRLNKSSEMKKLDYVLGPSSSTERIVSLRHALKPASGRVLISADYKQLELRILAHLSNDNTLISLLNSNNDPFIGIAAEINEISRDKVTDSLRNQAKQVCYGLIYGMGVKTLGHQLGSEARAQSCMNNFQSQFPKVQTYINEVIDSARQNGYVESLCGRKRYLQHINSYNSADRSACERQAVNTSIQSVASDLVKTATVSMESALRQAFPTSSCVLSYFGIGMSRETFSTADASGAHLVLQLHDELIYEVGTDDVVQVSQIMKNQMENVHHLSVSLPVKIKVGASWGSMQTLNI